MSEENVPKTTRGNVPNDDLGTEESNPVLENWTEFKAIPTQDLLRKGWKPRIKTRTNGRRYIMLRVEFKDSELGKWRDAEKSLGPYDPERWEALMRLYVSSVPPIRESQVPNSILKEHGGGVVAKPSVLATKVARVSPIGPTVHLELRTLQWYEWLRKDANYPGTLDDFINQSVNTLFREHYNLELAVVDQGEK